MSALSELLTASNKANLSARSVARAAQDAGYTLNHDTAARYLRGDHGRPDEITLIALADVFGIPLAKLRRAAELPSGHAGDYIPPLEANRLNRRQRRAVDEIIRAMLEPTVDAGSTTASQLAPRPTNSRSGRSSEAIQIAAKAARRGRVERGR
jgi:transcriptional regulator with XRE-family HTH domain